ncbi:major facilitator superfamily domain-containing protein [Xylariaceae sp. FL0804]|nr:major facilitator superfamily domain-containing protein [Xylariaceae sp. FL0804]
MSQASLAPSSVTAAPPADAQGPAKAEHLGSGDAESTHDKNKYNSSSSSRSSNIRDHAPSTEQTARDDGLPANRRSSHSSQESYISEGEEDEDEDEGIHGGEDEEAPAAPASGSGIFGPEVTRVRTATSVGSSASRPADYEVTFDGDSGEGSGGEGSGDGAGGGKGESEDPRLWSVWYRAWVIFAISYTTWVVVLYSTSYTATTPALMAEFGEASEPVVTLGVTTYLLGLACGSLVVAPASELFGRRPIYIGCMVCFALLLLPACLATSLEEIIIVRFFGALFGAAMVSNSAGTVVDISTDKYRGLVMSLWSIAPLNGPVTGPVIGGFVYQYLGWRWDSWLVLILAGGGIVAMAFTRETYAPIILQRKAARLRRETGDERYWCPYDQKLSRVELLKVNLLRPFVLALTEPILWFFNLWISLIYGILYLCFVAYPIVFSDHRGWGPGDSGLAFVGIGIGTMIAILGEPLWRRIIQAHPADAKTGEVPPEATARVLIIGAVLAPLGELGFSWTCLPTSIHWAVPIAFGVPFGLGNSLSFIYGSSYLAGAYGIYAASALAGNAVTRSFFGGTLPLAGPAMYRRLSPQWAGTLLGLLELLMVPIPFVFYRYGARIRAKSRIIRQMREDRERSERRAERARRARAAKRSGQNGGDGGGGGGGKSEGLGNCGGDVEKGVRGAAVEASLAMSKDETDV